ncbi:hypothetical protein BKA70DRAFT_1220464 [Coprinopsis sp. MPI-PUGE-AT-0042]|nr:hypothetical protein BKA70DRAFT_1220464 [Coprinopsis sp. MPI-PUGE-AT-0042]
MKPFVSVPTYHRTYPVTAGDDNLKKGSLSTAKSIQTKAATDADESNPEPDTNPAPKPTKRKAKPTQAKPATNADESNPEPDTNPTPKPTKRRAKPTQAKPAIDVDESHPEPDTNPAPKVTKAKAKLTQAKVATDVDKSNTEPDTTPTPKSTKTKAKASQAKAAIDVNESDHNSNTNPPPKPTRPKSTKPKVKPSQAKAANDLDEPNTEPDTTPAPKSTKTKDTESRAKGPKDVDESNPESDTNPTPKPTKTKAKSAQAKAAIDADESDTNPTPKPTKPKAKSPHSKASTDVDEAFELTHVTNKPSARRKSSKRRLARQIQMEAQPCSSEALLPIPPTTCKSLHSSPKSPKGSRLIKNDSMIVNHLSTSGKGKEVSQLDPESDCEWVIPSRKYTPPPTPPELKEINSLYLPEATRIPGHNEIVYCRFGRQWEGLSDVSYCIGPLRPGDSGTVELLSGATLFSWFNTHTVQWETLPEGYAMCEPKQRISIFQLRREIEEAVRQAEGDETNKKEMEMDDDDVGSNDERGGDREVVEEYNEEEEDDDEEGFNHEGAQPYQDDRFSSPPDAMDIDHESSEEGSSYSATLSDGTKHRLKAPQPTMEHQAASSKDGLVPSTTNNESPRSSCPAESSDHEIGKAHPLLNTIRTYLNEESMDVEADDDDDEDEEDEGKIDQQEDLPYTGPSPRGCPSQESTSYLAKLRKSLIDGSHTLRMPIPKMLKRMAVVPEESKRQLNDWNLTQAYPKVLAIKDPTVAKLKLADVRQIHQEMFSGATPEEVRLLRAKMQSRISGAAQVDPEARRIKLAMKLKDELHALCSRVSTEGSCEVISILVCEDDRLSSVVVGREELWEILDHSDVLVRPVLGRINSAVRSVKEGLVKPKDINVRAIFSGKDESGEGTSKVPPAATPAPSTHSAPRPSSSMQNTTHVPLPASKPLTEKEIHVRYTYREGMTRLTHIPVEIWKLMPGEAAPPHIPPELLNKFCVQIPWWLCGINESLRDWVVRFTRHKIQCLVQIEIHKLTSLKITTPICVSLPSLLIQYKLVIVGYSPHCPHLPGVEFYSNKFKQGVSIPGAKEMVFAWLGHQTVPGGPCRVERWPQKYLNMDEDLGNPEYLSIPTFISFREDGEEWVRATVADCLEILKNKAQSCKNIDLKDSMLPVLDRAQQAVKAGRDIVALKNPNLKAPEPSWRSKSKKKKKLPSVEPESEEDDDVDSQIETLAPSKTPTPPSSPEFDPTGSIPRNELNTQSQRFNPPPSQTAVPSCDHGNFGPTWPSTQSGQPPHYHPYKHPPLQSKQARYVEDEPMQRQYEPRNANQLPYPSDFLLSQGMYDDDRHYAAQLQASQQRLVREDSNLYPGRSSADYHPSAEERRHPHPIQLLQLRSRAPKGRREDCNIRVGPLLNQVET